VDERYRASDLPMLKSQQSLLQSQHPPTQCNEAVLNKNAKKPFKKSLKIEE
jgi:hypothetical protein